MKNSNLEISVIIPCCNDHDFLFSKLKDVTLWSKRPSEIVVVDSSNFQFNKINEIQELFLEFEIIFNYIFEKNLFPGKARNIGIRYSKFNYIGLLDVHTIPPHDWLEVTFKQFVSLNEEGCILGTTKYYSTKKLPTYIKYATYGNKSHITVPGSILNKTLFYKVGQFIEFTRAGEDTDWIKRYELQGFQIYLSNSTLIYNNLNNINIIFLIKKWFRNYSYSANLPYLNAHKNIYFYFLICFLFNFSFNWNWIIAKWDINSPFYVPHITKIFTFLLIISYIIFRSLILPYRKGVNLIILLKGAWLPVFFISLIIDFVKVFAFIFARFKNA